MNKTASTPSKTPPRLPFMFWVGLFLMITGGLGWVALQLQKSQPLEVMAISLGNKTYQVEVAQTPNQRSQGLMHRKHLDADKGMLFLFNNDEERSIWMKDTLIPLDVLFFDKEGRLVSWKDNAPPCKADPCAIYPSGGLTRYIVELAAGQRAALDLQVGDRMLPAKKAR